MVVIVVEMVAEREEIMVVVMVAEVIVMVVVEEEMKAEVTSMNSLMAVTKQEAKDLLFLGMMKNLILQEADAQTAQAEKVIKEDSNISF